MKNTTLLACLLCALAALTGCTSTGTGQGQLTSGSAPEESVSFSWISTDGGMTGTMSVTMFAQTFEGRFFQITQQTRREVLDSLWTHWRHGWHDWPHLSRRVAPPLSSTQFITHYSGKVVATLMGPDQQRMRCRFHLVEPARGLSGGGEGECQLGVGRLLRASFPAQ